MQKNLAFDKQKYKDLFDKVILSSIIKNLQHIPVQIQSLLFLDNLLFQYNLNTINNCKIIVQSYISRLDFENFVLGQPESVDHVCVDDKFIVSGGPPIPAICGTNTGQHCK